MIWFQIFLKLVGNGLDFVCKSFGHLSDTSFNKISWNNWLVLKMIDGCQLLLPSGLLVNTS